MPIPSTRTDEGVHPDRPYRQWPCPGPAFNIVLKEPSALQTTSNHPGLFTTPEAFSNDTSQANKHKQPEAFTHKDEYQQSRIINLDDSDDDN